LFSSFCDSIRPYVPANLVKGPKKPPSYRASAKEKKSKDSLSSSERRLTMDHANVNYSEIGRRELEEMKEDSAYNMVRQGDGKDLWTVVLSFLFE
jgi:hypothetical protein